MDTRWRWAPLVMGLALTACGERSTTWNLAYEPAALSEEASALYVEIREGSCDGRPVFAADLDRPGPVPRLEPGQYGFFARAADASCQWFASGCEARKLPLSDGAAINLILTAEARVDRCPGACSAGRCSPARDAGPDGGTGLDSGPITDGGPRPRLAIEVTTGRAHSCARTRDDSVYCWGLNESLQLGAITGAVDQLEPVRVEGLNGPVALSAGGNGQPKDGHTCAVVAGGEVRCWGDNLVGQLGTAMAGAPRATPETAVGVSGARGIDSGRQHSCAVTAQPGGVFCWGANESGQVGAPSTAIVATPIEVPGLNTLMQVATGGAHSCASLGTGDVRCWGRNADGQLGNDSAGAMSSTPVPVQGLGAAASISLGNRFTCALLMDGDVQCWGTNDNGVLGDPSHPAGATPRTVSLPDRAVAQLAAGTDFACARMVAGDIHCWGSNRWGALGRGDGSDLGVLTPGAVDGIDDAIDLSAGNNHLCAVTSDGAVYCWGRGQQGRLGNGDALDRYSPTRVVGFGE